ncbi:MAG: MBL fold metallo-hydrolase [Patescibacteria group bacterium]
MKLSFHGACQQVTGSCTLVETSTTKFLVDCGMFQGSRFAEEDNFKIFAFDPKLVAFVILTHAHVDHCARLPKLYQDGFRGRIYCTPATRDLTEIILLDAAKVMKEEARKNNHPILFNDDDVYGVMALFWPVEYHQKEKVTPEITVCFNDAGHILGSVIAEIWVIENSVTKKIVFSGDLGNPPAPLMRDTEFISGADFVVVESTYGGRIHEAAELRVQLLREAIMNSIGRGGVLMIPVFALERIQEVLYELHYLSQTHQIPQVPVFVDSPLAIEAVDIYKKYAKYYDDEAKERINSGEDLFKFPGLEYANSVEESKKINHVPSPKVVLAGSGMMNGGRILYHLKNYLPDARNHVLIISFQAEGSLGRRLRDGEKQIKIDKEPVTVKAQVSAIGSYSSHADQPKLLHWLKQISSPRPQKIFINHGEPKSSIMLADGVKQKLKIEAIVVQPQKTYEI